MYFLDQIDFWCFAVPLLFLLFTILFVACVIELFQRKKYRKALNVLTTLVIIFSLQMVSIACISDNNDEDEILKEYYDYNVWIENSGNSTIGIDIPLPHDEAIYQDLSFVFYQDFPYKSKWPSSARFEASEYGKVLHVETNSTTIDISLRHPFYDCSKVDPALSLTTQQGNSTYIKLTNNSSGNVSIYFDFGHVIELYSDKEGHRSENEFLSIMKESDTGSMVGVPLDEGWNLVPVRHRDWTQPLGSDRDS